MTKTETPADETPEVVETLPANFKKTKADPDRILDVDPDDLVIACSPDNPFYRGPSFGPDHPTYTLSADAPIDENAVDMFYHQGFVGGLIETRKEGGCLVVTDGRKRTRELTLANRLREKKGGEKIMARVLISQEDDTTSFLKTILLNNYRRRPNPLEQASQISHLIKNLKFKDKKQIARLYGWQGTDTVNLRLKLLEAAPEVRTAVEAGEITASDAMRLVNLPPDKQVKRLASIPKKTEETEAGKVRRSPAKAAKAKEAAGKRGKARKPSEVQLTQILDEIEDNKDATAYNVLRYAMGLIGISKAAEFLGLDKESPVYRHLKDKENAAKEAE